MALAQLRRVLVVVGIDHVGAGGDRLALDVRAVLDGGLAGLRCQHHAALVGQLVAEVEPALLGQLLAPGAVFAEDLLEVGGGQLAVVDGHVSAQDQHELGHRVPLVGCRTVPVDARETSGAGESLREVGVFREPAGDTAARKGHCTRRQLSSNTGAVPGRTSTYSGTIAIAGSLATRWWRPAPTSRIVPPRASGTMRSVLPR